MKNEKELLNLFTAPDLDYYYRPWCGKPFKQDGYICASDSHVLMRIKETLCEAEYEENPDGNKPPEVGKIVPERNIDKPLLKRQLKKALDKTGKISTDCPECGGYGIVEWEYKDRHGDVHTHRGDCPICHGSGERPTYDYSKIRFFIYGALFSYHNIDVLYRAMMLLGVDELRVRNEGKGLHPMLLTTDEVEILMMPYDESRYTDAKGVVVVK